jgi:hypothetical protein
MTSPRRLSALINMAQRGTPGEARNARSILGKLGHSMPADKISRSRLPARMADTPRGTLSSGQRALSSGQRALPPGQRALSSGQRALPPGAATRSSGQRVFPMGPASSGGTAGGPVGSSVSKSMQAANKRGQYTSRYTAPAPTPSGGRQVGMSNRTKVGLGIAGAAAVGVAMNRRGEGSSSGRQSAYRY